ncbi:MLO-like protein 9 [Senna tora]|uniref:MLO-like protein n=1 Tax=Senna tora TaxID=362788 RepID=A0A834T9Q7_9FABA|nr:MLO-like protein 9 [Senna tora]
MGGGGGDVDGDGSPARELDETSTWAVSLVCAIIVMISIILEEVIHKIAKVFEKKRKSALLEALEKIKNELMVLGFISLLLTFGQNFFSAICIPTKYANTMLPCPRRPIHAQMGGHRRRLLSYRRRFLSSTQGPACQQGFVPLISVNGLHQLHIFIFFLAVFHVFYSAITMTLGRLKIRAWKVWEREYMADQEAMNDPRRFRLTHEVSFVRAHNSFWTKTLVSFYIACFFRQFFRSVRKADYLTMRHGFVPILWASVVLFLLVNVHGWHASFWVSFLPLLVILTVGTKLQGIITRMALDIQERHAVVQGIPLVQVSDKHFWFGWPQLILYLIHYVLFQNAFELTYVLWTWYEFGVNSCFHEDSLLVTRVTLGIGAQIVCSYVTLPLYALVTQMGSTMKKSIFDDQTSKALKKWHQNALKRKSSSGKSATQTLGAESPLPKTTQESATILTQVDLPTPNTNSYPYANHDLLK